MSEKVKVSRYQRATGRITGRIHSSEATANANATADYGTVPGHHNGRTHYVSDGAVQERPFVAVPAPTAAPWRYDLTGLPGGSTVVVENEAGDTLTVTPEDGSLTLTDAGVYRLTCEPPFPWIGYSVEVSLA